MSTRQACWVVGFIWLSLAANTSAFAQFKPDYQLSVAVSDVFANPQNKPDLLAYEKFVKTYRFFLEKGKIDLFSDVDTIEVYGKVPTVPVNRMMGFTDAFGKMLIVARLKNFGAFRALELAGNLVRQDGDLRIYKIPRDLLLPTEPEFYFAFIESRDTAGGQLAMSGDPDFASLAISRLPAIRRKMPESYYLSASANTKFLEMASIEFEKQTFVDQGANLAHATGPWLTGPMLNAIDRTRDVEVWLNSRPNASDLAVVRVTCSPGFGPAMHAAISAMSGQQLAPGEPPLPTFAVRPLVGDKIVFSFDFKVSILKLLQAK